MGKTLESGAAARDFREEGYVIVPGLLDRDEVARYTRLLQEVSGLSDGDFNERRARIAGWSMADGVTKLPAFWPIIFHPRLVSAVREVLGPTARYTQHSDLHVHHGATGWHRDSANRKFGVGPDWDESREPYLVARVAIYLQGFAESGSAIGFVPGSQRQETALTSLELRAHGVVREVLKHQAPFTPLLSVKQEWHRTEPGDCAIFNQRILHSGSPIRGPKYAIFLSYGADNEHSRRHQRYYREERSELNYGDFHPELARRLREAGLLLEA